MSKSRSRRYLDLEYHIHDGAAAFRLKLSGDLSEDGVRDLDQVWRTASSIIGQRAFLVDIRLLTSIDQAGQDLLDSWQAIGAQLIASPPEPSKPHPLQGITSWGAAALLLLFPRW